MRWLYRLLHRRALRRGQLLDRAHQSPSGDRRPLMSPEQAREWLR